MKRIVSMILTVCLTLSMFVTLGMASGLISSSAAATSNEANELWLLEGSSKAYLRGRQIDIENGAEPYRFMGASLTAYVPLDPVCQFFGGSYTRNKNTVTVNYGTATATLRIDSKEWSVSTGAETQDFGLPVLLGDDGAVYVTTGIANSVANTLMGKTNASDKMRHWMHHNAGIVVFSFSSINYNENFLSTNSNVGMKGQLSVLNKMLFETPTGDEIYNDVANNVGLGTHPRILTTQSRFDELQDVYWAGVNVNAADTKLFSYISTYITRANTYFNTNFEGNGRSVNWKDGTVPIEFRQPFYIYDERGTRLVGVKQYTYPDGTIVTCDGSGYGDGYDAGGRLEVSVEIANNLPLLAFAYQITGDLKYAFAAYLVIKELGTWTHWGDCHSLNVADTAVDVAIAIDWMWHAFDNDTVKRTEMCDILFELGLLRGYLLVTNKKATVEGVSLVGRRNDPNHGHCSHYGASSTNNWQTVVGSGMIVSALTLMGNEKYDTYAKHVATTYLKNTRNAFEQYAPDGGYIESPGYWGYGTGTLFITLGSLESAAGTDYGHLDALGLQESFYFVAYICDSTFRTWDYHDGSWSVFRGTGNFGSTTWMYMAAKLYGDPNIAYFRDLMLAYDSRYCGINDIIFYDKEMSNGADGTLSLDYYSQSIETVTMRNGWEQGSDFIGLHAGPNRGPHSDFDSGNFYINLGGVPWVKDLGSENYNVGSYFTASRRYYYFRKSSESHNTIVIDNMTYGQTDNNRDNTNDYAKIIKKPTDNGTADGSFAIANMKPQYGTTCTAAQRGLLYTNSRKTVVVQDEMTFSEATDVTWVANIEQIEDISDDGKTIICRSRNAWGDIRVMRVTLISSDPSLRFERTGTGVGENASNPHILAGTVSKYNPSKYSWVDDGKISSPTNRCIINADDVTSLKIAVVFELIGHESEVVGYEWKDMSTWATDGIVSDEWVKDANSWIDYGDEEPVGPTYKYTIADLVQAMNKITAAKTEVEKMNAIFNAYMRTTDIDKTNSQVIAKIVELNAYMLQYNAYVRGLNSVFMTDVISCITDLGK